MKICQNPSPAGWTAIWMSMFFAVAVANGWF